MKRAKPENSPEESVVAQYNLSQPGEHEQFLDGKVHWPRIVLGEHGPCLKRCRQKRGRNPLEKSGK